MSMFIFLLEINTCFALYGDILLAIAFNVPILAILAERYEIEQLTKKRKIVSLNAQQELLNLIA